MKERRLKYVDKVCFGIYSPEEIEKLASVEVNTPNTYDQDGIPIEHGILDEKMGTTEPSRRCRTCGGEINQCPGHFGLIKLSTPVINVLFIKQINNALTATCKKCGKVVLKESTIEEIMKKYRIPKNTPFPQDAVQEVCRKARNVKTCPYCGTPKNKIVLEKPYFFYENISETDVEYGDLEETEDNEEREEIEEHEEESVQQEEEIIQELRKREKKNSVRFNRPLDPKDIRSWLQTIPDDQLYYIGMNPNRGKAAYMIFSNLPVAPITVRPTITLELGKRAEDDLTYELFQIIHTNEKYRDIIERGPAIQMIRDTKNLLQFHVAAYIDNEQPSFPQSRHRNNKPIKGIVQRIKGKEGRFRNNLLGKRVNFSARTVISPDPYLSLNEVGVPEYVAKILTIPVRVTPWNIEKMKELVRRGSASLNGANYVIKKDGTRKRLDPWIEEKPEQVAESLEVGDIVERHLQDGDIVLFNRQPSLHRMSIMAHRAKILPHRTFRLNLCACHPYNADFDGDEMNLHVLQSPDARVEAEELMLVEWQILSPRYGAPVMGLIQDFITASYMLTRDETIFDPEEVMQMCTWGGIEIKEPIRKQIPGKEVFSLLLPPDLNYKTRSKMADLCDKKDKLCFEKYNVNIENGKLISGVIDKKSIAPEIAESLIHIIAREYGQNKAREFIDNYSRMLLWYLGSLGITFRYHDTKVDSNTQKLMMEEYKKALDTIDKLNELWITDQYEPKHGLSKKESFEADIKNVLRELRDKFGDLCEKSMGLKNNAVIMYGCGSRGNKTNLAQMAGCVGQTSVSGKRIFNGYYNRTLPHFKWNSMAVDAHGFIISSFYQGLNPIEFFFHAMGGREGLVDTAIKTSQSGYMQRRMVNALNDYQVEFDGTVRDRSGEIISFVYGDDGIDPMYSYFGKAINVQRIIMKALSREIKRGSQSRNFVKEYLEKRLDESTFPEKVKNELKDSILAEIDKIGSTETIDAIIKLAEEEFEKSKIAPLSAVGVVAAQSIGEPGTQMTLRTFHFAGVEEFNVTLGLPRLIELVNARANISTPSMTIYIEPEHEDDLNYVEKIANKIRPILVEELIDPQYGIELNYYQNTIKVVFSSAALETYGFTPENIVEKIKTKFSSKKHEFDISGNTLVIKFGGAPVSLASASEKLKQVLVSGIPRIQSAYVYDDVDKNGKKYYYIRTLGSNLNEILRIEGIDKRRTTTNDIMEIMGVLGIEAARNALIREMYDVLQDQNLDVDYRHLILLADAMTASGRVQQIGRRGLSGAKESPLARAAFEETDKHIANAAAAGEEDPLLGTIERIIVGKPVTIGSGAVSLTLPMKLLKKTKNEETEKSEKS
ncbi:MAG: DNA-directed RNA polymerase subunit A' [Candidatus Korarchaeota archaeon]